MDGQDNFFVASSKAIRLILLVVSPKKIPLHRQTITDKFFEIVGQHGFPTKSGIDQFLYNCFLAVNFFFFLFLSVDPDTSNTFDLVFQSHLLTPNGLYGIRHFDFVPHFTLFTGPSTTQNSVTRKPT